MEEKIEMTKRESERHALYASVLIDKRLTSGLGYSQSGIPGARGSEGRAPGQPVSGAPENPQVEK
jgi:hypothetical protein